MPFRDAMQRDWLAAEFEAKEFCGINDVAAVSEAVEESPNLLEHLIERLVDVFSLSSFFLSEFNF